MVDSRNESLQLTEQLTEIRKNQAEVYNRFTQKELGFKQKELENKLAKIRPDTVEISRQFTRVEDGMQFSCIPDGYDEYDDLYELDFFSSDIESISSLQNKLTSLLEKANFLQIDSSLLNGLDECIKLLKKLLDDFAEIHKFSYTLFKRIETTFDVFKHSIDPVSAEINFSRLPDEIKFNIFSRLSSDVDFLAIREVDTGNRGVVDAAWAIWFKNKFKDEFTAYYSHLSNEELAQINWHHEYKKWDVWTDLTMYFPEQYHYRGRGKFFAIKA